MRNALKTVPATEIKNRFGDYLGEVVHGKRPLLIERHGKPVAVLVKFEEWAREGERGGGESDTPWSDACEQLAREIAKTQRKEGTFSAVRLLRKIRDEE